jgi:exonuclease III
MRNRWSRDAGLRPIIFCKPWLSSALVVAGVDRQCRLNASDHAPTWIELDLRGKEVTQGVKR